MNFQEFKAKTVDEAITAATLELGISSDQLQYEVIDEGSKGIGAKQAVIRARKKEEEAAEEVETYGTTSEKKSSVSNAEIVKKTDEYLAKLFKAMDIETEVTIDFDEENNNMDINLEGSEMGILIGKRGQTLDSLQYLANRVANKHQEGYVRVKLDTENYRARREETLRHLAKNIAHKVKRNRRPVALEPMNPYERRIIHSALQSDPYVMTHSEGEEPFRKVVITLKK